MFSNIIELPTDFGIFKCFVVKDKGKEHLVLYRGETENQECFVRVHSECLTGDLFKSQRCDCGYQLDSALKTLADKNGILIYLKQEGRDIGLFNKIQAYGLQDKGFDTVEANIELGLPVDDRNYDIAAKILQKLGPSKINLLTNNPCKLTALQKLLPIEIERVAIQAPSNRHNEHYLMTKIIKMNHLMEKKHAI